MSAERWIGVAFIALAVAIYVAGWFSRQSRELDRHIVEVLGEDADAEWAALVAATETPIFDQLTCEAIERAEGWVQP